jgi:hypothetical protein
MENLQDEEQDCRNVSPKSNTGAIALCRIQPDFSRFATNPIELVTIRRLTYLPARAILMGQNPSKYPV